MARMFQRRAVFVVDPTTGLGEDRLMEIVLDVGAEDLVPFGDGFAIHAAPSDFVEVKGRLEAAQLKFSDAGIEPLALDVVTIHDLDDGRRLLKLIDALEEHDDVQNVAANFKLSDEVAEQVSGDA